MSSRVLTSLLNEMEEALEEVLDDEIERVEGERDFLLSVLDGRADDVSVESTSTDVTTTYLSGYLSQYIPIAEDGS